MNEAGERERARRAVSENPVWYHTIELAPGVSTSGYVDLRRVAAKLLPDDLSGKRALDVGTFDGFWAFEMEKRGAEVVATDVERIGDAEWPGFRRAELSAGAERLGLELGRGFLLAAEALESRVERVICDVYDLTADAVGGQVDFVFSGAILVHLRDPVKALENILRVLRPGGELRLMEPFSVALTLRSPRKPAARFSILDTRFNWWVPNLAGLRAWCAAAGFADARRLGFVRPPSVRQMRSVYACLGCRREP